MFNTGKSYSKLITVPNFNETVSNEISFTGLSDGGLVNCEAFKSWEDGINASEIEPDDIQQIANHISDEFNQAYPDIEIDAAFSGFSTIVEGNGTIYYDVEGTLLNDALGYGPENLVGSIAHEMGHNIVEEAFENSGIELTRLQQEVGADYIEGVVFGMTGIDPSGKYEFLIDNNTASTDYLDAAGRIDVIESGIELGEKLQFLSQSAPELMLDITDNDVLMEQLIDVMDDYSIINY